METLLLRNQEILPSDQTIKNVLPVDVFPIYEAFVSLIINEPYRLKMDWNYYRDGKAWLCKVCYKKKTVFWLSIWEGCFQVGFYFTAKNCDGIFALEIDDKIKTDFSEQESVGKLLPLIIKVREKDQLDDVLAIITYKKSLK